MKDQGQVASLCTSVSQPFKSWGKPGKKIAENICFFPTSSFLPSSFFAIILGVWRHAWLALLRGGHVLSDAIALLEFLY